MFAHPLQAEELLSLVTEALSAAVFRCRADEAWTIDYLSEGYRVLATRQAGASPLTYASFLARIEAKRVCAAAHEALLSRRPFVMQYDIQTSRGRRRVLERTCGEYSPNGRLLSLSGLVVDLEELISGTPLLEEPRTFFEPLLEHAPFPVYMVSRDGRMRVSNPAFDQFVHIEQGTHGRLLEELFPAAACTIFREQNERVIRTHLPLALDEPVQQPDRTYYFHTVKFPVWDTLEQRYAVGGVSVDISALVETTQALEVSRRSFELLANTIPQVVWTTTEHGKLDYCNDAFLRLCDCSREQMLGGSWLRLVQPEYLEEVGHAWEESLQTGSCFERTCRLGAPGKEAHWFLVRAQPLGPPLQTGTRWFGTCTDVDEPQRMVESLRFLAESGRWLLGLAMDLDAMLATVVRLLVPGRADGLLLLLPGDSSPGPRVWVAHEHPACAPAAEALQKLLRQAPRTPGLWTRALQEEEEEYLPQVDAELLSRRVPDGPMRQLHEALAIRTAIIIPLVARERVLGVMMLTRSEAMATFSKGERVASREFAQSVALLCDYASLHESLREAINLREEFISIAAHELRTPLTTLFLRLQQLRRALESQPSGKELGRSPQALLNGCTKQASRLSQLVEQLLDTARLRSGRLRLELAPVELGPLVQEVLRRHEADLARAGCELHFENRSPVHGEWDPNRLEQVVTNLLTNAMKYGAGRPIHVVVERSPEGEMALLRVRDEGIGIEPDMQERIFERFERAVTSRSYGGLGLGLYICRELIQAHGGHISVSSKPEQGSEFRVELPLPRALPPE